MRVLRLLLAAVVVAAALAAGFLFFAAIVLVGLLAFVIQFFWRRSRSPAAGPARSPGPVRGDDVIDVQATDVPPDLPPGR